MMSNYNTEINNSSLGETLLKRKSDKAKEPMNFTFAGEKKRLQSQTSSLIEDKTSKSLQKLKNLTIAKYKIIEATKLMPSILKKSVKDSIEKKEDVINIDEMKQYNTNANLEEIDFDNMKFVPKKKKAKKDNFTSKLNEIYSFDSPLKKTSTSSPNKPQVDPFKNEMKEAVKEFYRNYCEEMEKNYEQLFKRNENLLLKINYYKNLEEEYYQLQKEMNNLILFKKIMLIKNKNKELIDPIKDLNENTYFRNFFCENPNCTSVVFKYVELKRNYDDLLIRNVHLKKHYSDIRNKKTLLSNSEAQVEEFF